MANILVWNTLRGEIHGNLCLDEANRLCDEGHNVYLLDCDESIGGCYFNRCFDKRKCKSCILIDNWQRRGKLNRRINTIKAKEIISKLEKNYYDIDFDYTSIDELRSQTYKNVDLGSGFLSSYIDYTRKSNPALTPEIRSYINAHLKQMCIITDMIDFIIDHFAIERIIFCNGRLAQLKPALDLALSHGLHFTSVEIKGQTGKNIFKDYRDNTTQHDAEYLKKACEEQWKKSKLPDDQKIEIGKTFFENRRNKKIAGDKVYTLKQEEGLLPEDWRDDIENIVIFNSSEDEFAALGENIFPKVFIKIRSRELKILFRIMKMTNLNISI